MQFDNNPEQYCSGFSQRVVNTRVATRGSLSISINRRGELANCRVYASKCFPDNFPSFNDGASTPIRYRHVEAPSIFSTLYSKIASPLECRLNFNFGVLTLSL